MILLRRVESYEKVGEFVREAFELFSPKLESEVLVKPNFLQFESPESGCITHPEVVKAVIDVLRERGHEVVVAEGGFYRDSADKCFDEFGLRELAECVNINTEELVRVEVNGKALKEVEAGKNILKAMNSPFISLPKMKVHTLAVTTLGIKNNMGFLKKPAMYMHLKIHQKLVDLLHILNPALTIVDGVIGGAGSESSTTPVHHGVMVAGDNVIEVDAVSSYLMGFEPEKIGYIRKASEEFGVDLENIEVRGDDPDELRVDYSRNFLGRVLGKFSW
ncbi:hypothetical protein GAH_01206 [Geoglobus ahangari]|uniref:DUF362 domain-containing protein n=1 Tax=Geoglobus ahangari TaxID=113653 RepID=A0A0F7IEQ3_9EURY|nr:DUF362 domain-containing protein [Geoglobus ahangari]AKG91484.1 hypothetical protein GAH_01206 [Geoglobus ahangari]